jgi:hypothetical protein
MLTPDLLARLHTSRFWNDYLHFTEPDEPLLSGRSWEIPLDLGASVGLDLAIDYGTSSATLLIRDFGERGVPIEVAWDDQAHWHPHVFRWTELDALCRRIAARSAEYPHPGIPLLLLYRFAPLTSESEYRAYRPFLEEGWATLALFTADEIAGFIDRVDYRGQGVEWSHTIGLGWTVDQIDPSAERNLYSLRARGNAEFPFELWNTLMSEIAGEAASA